MKKYISIFVSVLFLFPFVSHAYFNWFPPKVTPEIKEVVSVLKEKQNCEKHSFSDFSVSVEVGRFYDYLVFKCVWDEYDYANSVSIKKTQEIRVELATPLENICK